MRKLCCLMGLFFFVCLNAQERITLNHDQSPLRLVLQDIESKTGILFSFSEEVVKNLSVTILQTNITLTDALNRIEAQTNLVLERISDQQVILRKKMTVTSICGYVIDGGSGEILEAATVLLENGAKGTTTNSEGYFKIENMPLDAVLRIQYIGFKDMLVPVADHTDKNCENIPLIPETQTLDEVIVLGYLTTGVHKNADGSFTLVKDDLGIFPGLVEPDVLESIQFAPGISSLDESASGIQIRGGSPDQNLIFFDGVKMYNTGHFFGMISAFNPYIVESAKIYKGGASPKYGDRISGVIDISSGAKVADKVSGGFGVNGTHADVFVKAPLSEHVGIIVSGRRSYVDLLKTPTFDALSEKVFQNTTLATNTEGQFLDDDDDDDLIGREDFLFYDTNAKIIIQPTTTDRITVSALYTKNELDFSVRDDEDIVADVFNIENKGASFSYEGSTKKKWFYGLKGYYSALDSRYENNTSEDNELEALTLRRNTVEDIGADIHLAYAFLPQQQIQIGYQYSKLDVFFQLFYSNDLDDDDDFQSRNFDVVRNGENTAHSIYTEYTYRFKNKGFFSLGARASRYSVVNNDNFIEPRANLELPITPKIRFKGTFEKRYQPVSQLVEFEDIQLRLENNIWTVSNGTDIPILQSNQYSAGILVNTQGWTLDVDAYQKNISGLTSFTNGFTTTPTNLTTGESTITGVDVLLRKKWNAYTTWVGYTFNDVAYTFSSLQTGAFPGNNDITHNLSLANTYETDIWQFSLGWNYRTGSPFTPVTNFNPNTNFITYGSINSERLPDYHRLDGSVLYKFTSSSAGFRGALGIAVKNIYARQEPISIFYRLDPNVNTGNTELNQIRQLSQGITPNFVLRFYF
ncbi:TonB-dependent receptor [Arenibacter sp. GZD96]|uniref:TonB-dependent receptor n=1 Tax=Aurantibrevibacter litoralis TaxID=3106030 RepID=UPI002AFEEE4F|nr:TonB-dependent receptor [Arenibacter sp. GZD-96]MEA1786523.1 TonB-dependent receptor [Arenibacter sp. GZD-96]